MAGISPARKGRLKGNAPSGKGKVNKAPPPTTDSRYAVISAELLQQLQKEVGKQPSPRDLLHELQQRDATAVVKTASPAPARQKSGIRAARATGYRTPIAVKNAAVSTDEEGMEDGLPAPPGARHASVGTVNAVEEGTQTMHEQEQPIVQVYAAAAGAPSSSSSPKAANAVPTLLLLPPPHQQQVVPYVQIPDVTQGVASHQAVVMPPSGLNSPHVHGFSDLWYMDRAAAEREKERKRLQAQILAEQIEEQQKRKEEEHRKRQEEDFREEQRLERERREIEERHQREQAELAAKNRAMEEGAKDDPPPAGPKSRRRSKEDGEGSANRGAGGTYTTTAAADSTGAGPWVGGEERRRRRRRRRVTDDTQGGGNDGSWRTTEQDQKRTWHDPHANSLSLRLADGGRDTASPVPWLQGDEGLSTVQEASQETKRTEARRRRTRRRERDGRDARERQESEAGEWATAQRNPREVRRDPSEDRRGAAWTRSEEEEDEPRLRRRGGRSRRSPGPGRGEQATSGEDQAHAPDRDRNVTHHKHLLSPKLSDTELREQIGSLVRVCEVLLRERADDRESDISRRGHSPSPRNAKTSPSLAASPPPPEMSMMDWRPPHAPNQRGPAAPEVSIDGPPRAALGGAAGNDGLVSARSHASHASKHTYSRHDGHHGGAVGHGHYGMNGVGYGGAGAGGGGSKVSDMNSWGADDPRSGLGGSPEPWPSDALVELLQEPLLGGKELPGLGLEGQSHLRGGAEKVAQATAAESSAARDHARPHQVPINVAASPFSPPMIRGMAVRRNSGGAQGGLQTPSGVFNSGMAGPGWGGRMLASPPPMSRGGLNVQANWVPLGLGSPGGNVRHQEGLEGIYPSLLQEQKGPEKQGPGQVPIGINPSIQAQSAILREMYPNAAAGSGLPGPLSLP
mmetsp:Transcript_35/g.63  ORF Transcript_35/g.63 Transcript_35/m.63 type:complete len:910 (-) Transcript_35:37-2766(-)